MQEFQSAQELREHYAALRARNKWAQKGGQDGRLIPLKPVPTQFRYQGDRPRRMENVLRGPVVWQSSGSLAELAREIEDSHGLAHGTLIAKAPKTQKVFRARREFCFRALHLCKTCSQVARFLHREHSTILSQADHYRREHERELAANPGMEGFPVSESSGGGRVGSMQQPSQRPGWGEIEGFRHD